MNSSMKLMTVNSISNMKAKLKKQVSGGFYLLDENNNITSHHHLSLKNCQAIELGYDLDELAEERLKSHITFKNEQDYSKIKGGFIIGFRTALDCMGDKKFSEVDMNKAFRLGHSLQTDITLKKKEYKPSGHFFEELIQSLQQTEWDVEIEMKYHPTFQIVKLDADGCLILKRI